MLNKKDRLTPMVNISNQFFPVTTPIIKMTATTPNENFDICSESVSIASCSGVFLSPTSFNSVAILPNSVSDPVLTTIPFPFPFDTRVPINAIFY
jgi:hypothetical protein